MKDTVTLEVPIKGLSIIRRAMKAKRLIDQGKLDKLDSNVSEQLKKTYQDRVSIGWQVELQAETALRKSICCWSPFSE